MAGTTASKNRFGQYYRTRAIPVQPRTPKATNNRAFLTVGSSAWRTLSDAQRTAWNDFAAQITRSGRLGSGYSPTGPMLFSGAAVLNGGAAVTDPPLALPLFVLAVTGMTYVDPTPGPEALSVAITVTDAHNSFIADTSGPVSPGVTSAAAVRRWRSLPLSGSNLRPNQFSMAGASVAMLTQYKFLFPSPQPGQAIWFRFKEISIQDDLVGVTNKLYQTFRLVIP